MIGQARLIVKKIRSVVPVLALTLVIIGFQNCSNEFGSFSSIGRLYVDPTQGRHIASEVELPDTRVTGINYSKNLIASMTNQLGVAPSSDTRNNIASQISKVPDKGTADAVTAPMFVAITTVASDLCRDLVAKEQGLAAGSRRFFGKVDFSQGAGMITPAAKDDVVRRLARNLWSRNETPEERNLILAELGSQFSSGSAENAMIFVCTAMESSLDAHRQ